MWAMILAGGIALSPFPAAPAPNTYNCSKPEYRQTHLAECNLTSNPPIGGGPGRRGLLGLGGIGGIL
jgi:hypothetical protein